MEEKYQQVLNYLNSDEVEAKVITILDENFSVAQKENCLKVWQQMKDLEFDVRDWHKFLLFISHDDMDKAERVDDELFENVLIEIYDEIDELYRAKHKNVEEKVIKEELKTITDLPTAYQAFTASSFFQNILAAEKRVTEEASGDEVKFKDLFYQAINGGDKIRFCGMSRQIFNSGVRKFFSADQRYGSFMQNFLNNRPDKKDWEEFKTNPAQKKFIILFIRLIAEKKMGVASQDSAMIGTGLAALAAKNNELEYAEIAYGDEEQNKFVWSE